MHLEIVPPLMSVSILLIVISFVLHNSIHTLVLDANRSKEEQSEPNLRIMMVFSSLNLLLDLVNVSCFARAQHLMGFNTDAQKEVKEVQQYSDDDENDGLIGDYNFEVPPSDITTKEPNESEQNDEDERVNLNMCSAYTHVFADTLRSIAVVIASTIAVYVESLTPEVADSAAAVFVSFIILASLLPLFRGLCRTWGELRSITLEEQASSAAETDGIEGEIS